MMYRRIAERVERIAPFLSYDPDPYLDDHATAGWSGCRTSTRRRERYPYSTTVDAA